MMMPSILGIDPSATRTGLAYAAQGVWYEASHPIDEWNEILRFIQLARLQGCTRAVFEKQMGVNGETAALLNMVRGRIVQMCVELGMSCDVVIASQWQKEMLTDYGLKGHATSMQRKDASLQCAIDLGADPANADEADAVCIAEWAMRMEAFAERVGG